MQGDPVGRGGGGAVRSVVPWKDSEIGESRNLFAMDLAGGSPPPFARHRPFELVPRGRVRQVLQREFVRLADAVGPVGADAEPRHVGDDQQRRVLQRQRVLPQLVESRVQVGAPALVFPGEAMALPHIGPAVAAAVLARPALEAIALARRVGFRRRRLAEQPAQIDEVLLRRRALLQLGRPPLGDERSRRHAASDAAASPPSGRAAILVIVFEASPLRQLARYSASSRSP